MKDLSIFYCTILVLVLASDNVSFSDDNANTLDGLKKQFLNPSNEYRALPMYSFDFNDIPTQINKLKDGGWGGANLQFSDQGKGYMLDEKSWGKYRSAIESLNKNDFIAWIYDERGYPSGKAGYLVLEDHPEYEAQGLYYATADFNLDTETDVEWRIPDGKPYYIAQYKTLGNKLQGTPIEMTKNAIDGILRMKLKSGNWRLMAFVQNPLYKGTHSDYLGERYVNLMDPNATDRFIEMTHEKYYQNCGDYFGNTIKAFFTDEPSLMGGYLKDEVQEYPALSWYDGLPNAFRSMHGYNIRQALPSLFNNTGADTARKRCDFYSTIAELTANNFFGRIQDWCRLHNVASGGHLVWEESLIYHANFYGNILKSLAKLDIPGIDLLGCNYGCTSGSRTEGGPVTPKLISSSAHINGRNRTSTESFCFVTKDTPLNDMISLVAWQWVLGINTLTTLSMQNEHSIENQKLLSEYTGRLSSLLTAGDHVTDMAILYPIASVWSEFTPINKGVWNFDENPKAKIVDDSWQATSRFLLSCQRDFDYLDESDIIKSNIDNGKIKINERVYKTLVLPNTTTLQMATLKQIKAFVESGGIIISCGDTPSKRADAGSTDDFRQIAHSIWNKSLKKANVIQLNTEQSLYNTLKTIPDADVIIPSENRDIYYQHRKLSDINIYFVLNNSKSEFNGDISFRSTGSVEIWDPFSKKMKSAKYNTENKYTSVNITVPGRNGIFVIFTNE